MRPPQMSDWREWAMVRAANQERIQPFEPQWSKNYKSEEFFQRRLARQSYEWSIGNANAFLIFKNDGEQLIGGMNINNIARGAAQYGSIGYWIDADHEGQGFMAEAIRLTLQYCFEDLGLHRVNASCLLHNERSLKTLLSAGFKEEGRAEKYLQINGQWQDHILFGLPIENWQKTLSSAGFRGKHGRINT